MILAHLALKLCFLFQESELLSTLKKKNSTQNSKEKGKKDIREKGGREGGKKGEGEEGKGRDGGRRGKQGRKKEFQAEGCSKEVYI